MTLEANYFDYEESDEKYKKWLIYILFSYFLIFGLFWLVFFKERAPKEIAEVINRKMTIYKTKLDELKDKCSIKIDENT